MTLVITADDLGLSPGVTKGILESHRRGVVRSTSLIVTADSSAEAAALARMEPDLEVGLLIRGTVDRTDLAFLVQVARLRIGHR